MEDNKFTFLVEAYNTYVEYYSQYVDGMWGRFNTLLTLNLALAGLFGSTWLRTPLISSKGVVLIPFLGLTVSILLYIQSAQERFIVSHHREQINKIRTMIEKHIGIDDVPALFYPLDDIDAGKRRLIFESVVSWRSRPLSITRIPAITSIIFVAIWIAAICMSL